MSVTRLLVAAHANRRAGRAESRMVRGGGYGGAPERTASTHSCAGPGEVRESRGQRCRSRCARASGVGRCVARRRVAGWRREACTRARWAYSGSGSLRPTTGCRLVRASAMTFATRRGSGTTEAAGRASVERVHDAVSPRGGDSRRVATGGIRTCPTNSGTGRLPRVDGGLQRSDGGLPKSDGARNFGAGRLPRRDGHSPRAVGTARESVGPRMATVSKPCLATGPAPKSSGEAPRSSGRLRQRGGALRPSHGPLPR
jgi:hypothetical protein